MVWDKLSRYLPPLSLRAPGSREAPPQFLKLFFPGWRGLGEVWRKGGGWGTVFLEGAASAGTRGHVRTHPWMLCACPSEA